MTGCAAITLVVGTNERYLEPCRVALRPRPFLPQRPCPTPQRSYSSGTGGECVEVTVDLPGLVPVRDSENPHGPALVFPVEAWSAFVGVL
ncbi:DUF397 domain-containing protein [Streptomyces mutabilis]|uniref:DUF397 domain-containing protein n=1 Tax=Streptomyces mutabilis TaxID=67332 RepID=UPI00379486C6